MRRALEASCRRLCAVQSMSCPAQACLLRAFACAALG